MIVLTYRVLYCITLPAYRNASIQILNPDKRVQTRKWRNMKLRISYVYGVQSLKEGNFISLATSVLYMKVNLPSKTTLIQYSPSNYTSFRLVRFLFFFLPGTESH